jgi:hypothetical protein
MKRFAAISFLVVLTSSVTPGAQSMKPDELDRLLAPIALYPDALLAQMLMSAQNPGKVAALAEWLASNSGLSGSELQDAATKSGFEPNLVALVLFPSVVQYMAEQVDWTTRLGKAFTADRSAVFSSIQRLRAQARDAGKLKTNAQQEVETRTTSSGEQVIVIEPTNPQVVYVPQYNPQTVYTQPTSTTVVVESDNSDAAVAAGLIGFTAGIAMGAAMDNDHYYGPYGWHGGGYMYNDAWDDYYDAREDAREDWYDNREDLAEERGERARETSEQRTERRETTQQQRTERTQTRQENRPATQSATAAGTSQGARGYSGSGTQTTAQRSGTQSDAFSGYSKGSSERQASQRGQRSRSSSRSGGGGGRRR